MRGHLTKKADVFSFGVVLLEIVSGRRNDDPTLEHEKRYLLKWAWDLHEKNSLLQLVDSTLSAYSEEAVKRVIGVSLLCTQESPDLRPSMLSVVAMLSGDAEVSPVASRPAYLTYFKSDDVTSLRSAVTTFRTAVTTLGTGGSNFDSSTHSGEIEQGTVTSESAILHEDTQAAAGAQEAVQPLEEQVPTQLSDDQSAVQPCADQAVVSEMLVPPSENARPTQSHSSASVNVGKGRRRPSKLNTGVPQFDLERTPVKGMQEAYMARSGG